MQIKSSVGSYESGATNNPADVSVVQTVLKNAASKLSRPEFDPRSVDGVVNHVGDRSATVRAIEAFQRSHVGLANPDRRIDVGGRTWKALADTTHLTVPPANVKDANAFSLSSDAVKLLKSIETLRLKPYDDQTGKDISAWTQGATIGYGHLIGKAEWATYSKGVSENQADTLFDSDVAPFVKAVNSKVTAKLSQQQFDALVILAFNIGTANFSSSSVLKLVNDPAAKTAYKDLETAWKAWNKSQGKVMKGLENRRAAEWKIYTTGKYEKW